MEPFQAALRRLARGRLHHRLDLDLAGGGVHPDLLHAGRDRPAVPRVRGGGGAGDPGLGDGLADAGADARQPLPAPTRRTEATRAALVAPVRARLRRACLRGYARSLDWALAHRAAGAGGGRRHLRRHGGAVRTSSRRASSPTRTSARSSSPPRRPRTSRSRPWSALHERAAAIVRADPNVAAVSSFNGGNNDTQNIGRMFITLKPRARARADEAGARGAAPQAARHAGRGRSTRGRCRTCSSAGAPARPATSTCCRAWRPTS